MASRNKDVWRRLRDAGSLSKDRAPASDKNAIQTRRSDVTAQDRDSKTALQSAAGSASSYGSESVDKLISAGEDVTARDKDGKTALHYAAGSALGKLISAGVDVPPETRMVKWRKYI
jgi:ankyrin repeat protein